MLSSHGKAQAAQRDILVGKLSKIKVFCSGNASISLRKNIALA
jgi:hypothetical protein